MNKNDKRIERNKNKIAEFKELLNDLAETFGISKTNKFLQCWKEEFTKLPLPMDLMGLEARPTSISARKGTFFSGYPFTNSDYPWPENSNGKPLVSVLQLDLFELNKKYKTLIGDLQLKSWLGKLKGRTGPRFLQVWMDTENYAFNSHLRLIPSIKPDLEREHYLMYFRAPFTRDSELKLGFHRAKYWPFARSAKFAFTGPCINEYILGDPFFLSGYFQETDRLFECLDLDESADKRVTKYKKRLERITNARSYGEFDQQVHMFGVYTEDAHLADAVDLFDRYNGGGWKCLIAKPRNYHLDSEPSLTVFYRFLQDNESPEFQLIVK